MTRAPADSLRRLAAAHWPLAAVCALFLVMGALVVDDYGVTLDEVVQRAVGQASLDYLAGEGERAFDQLHSSVHPRLKASDRYYGVALDAPLALVERALGLEDSRDVHLARHFLTHLFFLAGGVVCYLLVYRLFGSRALALAGMALFLLHPRLYAHSFFNSKDVPFLVMFMVALYLVHRAFRRDTLGAFLLCGVGVGLLANLRLMGLVLFAAVLVLRALDLPFASSREERRRILLTVAAFALAAGLTLLASLPILWTDPAGRFMEALGFAADRPWPAYNLFRGEWLYVPDGPPFDYLPVWVGITTPPATLLLALVGTAALAWRGVRRPRALPRNGPLRFGLLLVALPVVAAAAVAVLGAAVYDGWRLLYFLYAPLLLLALAGLQWLAGPRRGRWMRTGSYALAVAAVAVTLVSMVRIHPHQNSYFTALVDRTTPERLASRYNVNYWNQSARDVLAGIAADHPSGGIVFAVPRHVPRNRQMLPPAERARFAAVHDFRSGERNFYELRDGQPCPAPLPDGAYVSRVYATTLYCIVDPLAYFGDLRREALATAPLHRSRFDAHRVGNLLIYLRDGCSPDDLDARFFLHVHPVDPGDLPNHQRGGVYREPYGFERREFWFASFGARIDGDCVAAVPLPAWPIAAIRTGQYAPEFAGDARLAVAGAEPLARARFKVFLHPHDRALVYVRDACSAEDAGGRFFLDVFPATEDDVPGQRRDHGSSNLDFDLEWRGARTHDGACVAVVPLPHWPIATIHTGQFDDTGRLWAVEFAWPGGP